MMKNKQYFLDISEVVDSFRIFPRIFLAACFYGYLVEAWDWYLSLDYNAYDTGKLSVLTAFPVTLLTTLGGMILKLWHYYISKPQD